MDIIIEKTDKLDGEIMVPGSKSHTIRAVIIASLSKDKSIIKYPLKSEDTMAAVNACRALGSDINTDNPAEWIVAGFGDSPVQPQGPIDMGNSGTSARLIAGICSLFDFEVTIDGDESLRSRPMQELLDGLNQLGAKAYAVNGDGKCPVRIRGKLKGGVANIKGQTSQYVSSLLIAAPLSMGDTVVKVNELNEIPYVNITTQWLKETGVKVEAGFDENIPEYWYRIKGMQGYKPFEKTIPSDWSSATFPLVAAAITDSDVLIKGLVMEDMQGDKVVVQYLKDMGADISITDTGVRIKGQKLKGIDIDLNSTPDALPAMAVLGCFAKGSTKLYNVSQARIKETDRIKVMCSELKKMGADIQEMDDGLKMHECKLTGVRLNGHNDHRVVMSLALAGMIAEGITRVDTAEAVRVTFPDFVELMAGIGAKIRMEV